MEEQHRADRIAEEEVRRRAEEPPRKRKASRSRLRAGWIGLAAAVAVLAAVVATGLNGGSGFEERDVPMQVRVDDVKTHLYLTALELDGYHVRHGSYPDTLWEADVIEYAVEDDGTYTLSYRLEDTLVTYNSAESRNVLLTDGFLREVLGYEQGL